MGDLGTINIPYWLKDSLSARKEHCEVILDYAALRELFSFEDCVELLVAQRVNFPVFKSEDVGSSPYSLAEVWRETKGAKSLVDLERIVSEADNRINESLAVGRANAVESRLAGDKDSDVEVAVTSSDTPDATKKVEVITSNSATKCFVVLNKALPRLTVPEYYDLTERIVETFYTYGAAARVYRTPVMRTYMRMMAKQGLA